MKKKMLTRLVIILVILIIIILTVFSIPAATATIPVYYMNVGDDVLLVCETGKWKESGEIYPTDITFGCVGEEAYPPPPTSPPAYPGPNQAGQNVYIPVIVTLIDQDGFELDRANSLPSYNVDPGTAVHIRCAGRFYPFDMTRTSRIVRCLDD